MSTIALLLALLLLQPAPPDFTATWQGTHTARLSWTQPPGVALTCLYRQAILIRCYRDLAPGPTFTTLGDRGPLDASAHPAGGDAFTLTFDDVTVRARLRGVVWLGMVTKSP